MDYNRYSKVSLLTLCYHWKHLDSHKDHLLSLSAILHVLSFNLTVAYQPKNVYLILIVIKGVVENVITLDKWIGLLFCSAPPPPLLSILLLKIPKIQGMSSLMGTIF